MTDIDIEIESKKTSFKHPDCFNELKDFQFEKVVELFVLNKESLNNRMVDRLILLESLLRTNESKTENKKAFITIDNLVKGGDIDELLKLQSFLSKDQDFNHWIIKTIKADNKIFYGPKNQFSYMLFGEFIVADMLFMNYFETKNESILNKFIAIIYREAKQGFDKNSKADIRQTFNSEFLDYRFELFCKIGEITKQSILFNYAGIRYWLTKKYPFVFGGTKNESKTSIQLGNNQSGWMNIRRHLAGSVFNLEKVDKLLLSDVLSDLNEEMSK